MSKTLNPESTIGQEMYYDNDPQLLFKVVVKSVRWIYGRYLAVIEPVTGSGEKEVWFEKLIPAHKAK